MANLPPSPFYSSAAIVERSAEAPAVASVVAPSDVAAECFIGEIFVGALKMFDPDEHRFVLDEEAFMEAIEPLPLFLQAAQ
jgi:hypothetical protein